MSFTRITTAIFAGLFWIITGAGLYAQNAWETLPVFHGGRIMPMHTFAEQVVREICATEHPYVVWDNNVIAEFNKAVSSSNIRRQNADVSKQYQYVIPDGGLSTGGFNKSYSAFDLSREVDTVSAALSIQGLSSERILEISNRIQQLIPMDGRYFRADELILSWISEPEIWQFIPIFYAPKEYIDEFFDITFSENVPASQYRVSLYQLEQSRRFKLRSTEIQRRYQLGQSTQFPVPFDQITERLERQMQFFRELTFHPQRQHPTRMLAILYQTAGYTTEYSGTNSDGGRSSYMSAFESWGNLLTLGEIPSRQSMERTLSSDQLLSLHPTTERWHRIMDKLRFIMQIYTQTDDAGNTMLPRATLVEQQYEILIGLIDENLAESAALMEAVYPGVPYRADHRGQAASIVDVNQLLPQLLSTENPMSNQMSIIRQIVIRYHYSVKKLRQDIEAAYLALYDNGRSLRFLPLVSPYGVNADSSQDVSGIQPWASAQMILGSGDSFIKRFLESQLAAPPVALPTEDAADADSGDTDSGAADSSVAVESVEVDSESDSPDADLVADLPTEDAAAGDMLTDADSEMTEQDLMELLMMPFELKGGILQTRQDGGSRIASLRNILKQMSQLRSSLGRFESAMEEYGNSNFIIQSQEFAQAARITAEQIDHARRLFVLKDDQAATELLNQTTYPQDGTMLTEYRYTRLNLFYWMGLFAFFAALLNICAYVTASSRDLSVFSKSVSILFSKRGIKKEKKLQDYTNSVEEWLFVASVTVLLISIFTAFLGGAMRAAITGWTPVTNMYETVVMMAFITAVLGVWYTFSPLLNPALKLSWELSRFPRIVSLMTRLITLKARQSSTYSETDRDAAKREIVREFWLSEGPVFAGSPMAMQNNDHETEVDLFRQVKAAQRKIFIQSLITIPRILLSLAVLWIIVWMSNSTMLAQQGFVSTAIDMFKTTDTIDFIAVFASVLLIVWVFPHILFALLLTLFVICRPSWVAAELGVFSCESIIAVQEASKTLMVKHSRSGMNKVFHGETQKQNVIAGAKDTSGIAWLKIARNAVLDRKLFIVVAAAIVFAAGVIVSWNRVEFNPDIRPIMPVLRSNFWLTIHVIAIVMSYAAALVAWGMAVVSLGYVLFGRYQRMESKTPGGKMRVRLPNACSIYVQVIERLVKMALLFLVVGTVLGARWADYSWGRFWSWDPKEVWALVTILYYAIVLHGKAARYYGSIGLVAGALFGSIPIIITWYGINFVFKGSVHSYGGDAAGSTLFIAIFIMANTLWGALALLRYNAEMFGSETEA